MAHLFQWASLKLNYNDRFKDQPSRARGQTERRHTASKAVRAASFVTEIGEDDELDYIYHILKLLL